MFKESILYINIYEIVLRLNYSTTCSDKVQNNYTLMIANGMSCSIEEVKDVCVYVTTSESSYSMAFIDFEDEDILGVSYTIDDGTERFVAINKKYIVDIGVIYEQDINLINKETDNELNDLMYQ